MILERSAIGWPCPARPDSPGRTRWQRMRPQRLKREV
jgi:hypothetical protein